MCTPKPKIQPCPQGLYQRDWGDYQRLTTPTLYELNVYGDASGGSSPWSSRRPQPWSYLYFEQNE